MTVRTAGLGGAGRAVEGVVQHGQRLGAAGPIAQQLPRQRGHAGWALAQRTAAADGRHLDGRRTRLAASGLACRLRRAWRIPGAAQGKNGTSMDAEICL